MSQHQKQVYVQIEILALKDCMECSRHISTDFIIFRYSVSRTKTTLHFDGQSGQTIKPYYLV